MDRRQEDGEDRTPETHYLDGIGRQRSQDFSSWTKPRALSGTETNFLKRNCASCSKQNYSEGMIARLAGEPFEAIPCENLIRMLNQKQYLKLVLWDKDYTPRPQDCPKYKQEGAIETLKVANE